jgi:hypothetical protein
MRVAQAADGVPLRLGAWCPFASLAALHAGMFAYDLQHPGRFLNADRAQTRLEVIVGFEQALKDGNVAGYLSSHGIAGDWLPHALLYLAGGQYLVIAVQVILALASVYWLQQIGRRLGLGEGPAVAAAMLYGLMPHTLVFPHELATEALIAPLIILAFYFTAGSSFLAGGAAIGFATLIRPVTALWPLVQGFAQKSTPHQRWVYVAAGLAPLLAWMSFILAATGEFSMGRSGHDLGANLYGRMHLMAATLPEDERPSVRGPGERRAGIGEYLAFVAAHPVEAAKHSGRDLFTLVLKSGIERVTIDYLDLFPEQRDALRDPNDGWRRQLERRGPLATFYDLFNARASLLVSSALGAALFAALVALAVWGAVCWARERRVPAQVQRQRLLVGAFVLYTFATAQAVDAAQSRHRAPAEFALCLLAVAGWVSLKKRADER